MPLPIPTIEQVNVADHEQLARWWRFGFEERLDLEGQAFTDWLNQREVILLRIKARLFDELGGFTPEVSKKLGWDDPDHI